MNHVVECIEWVYTSDCEEAAFVRDRQYFTQGGPYRPPMRIKHLGSGYMAINERGDDHWIGEPGEKWFDAHFKLIV